MARTAVSKAAWWEFKSFCPCHLVNVTKRYKAVVYKIIVVSLSLTIDSIPIYQDVENVYRGVCDLACVSSLWIDSLIGKATRTRGHRSSNLRQFNSKIFQFACAKDILKNWILWEDTENRQTEKTVNQLTMPS